MTLASALRISQAIDMPESRHFACARNDLYFGCVCNCTLSAQLVPRLLLSFVAVAPQVPANTQPSSVGICGYTFHLVFVPRLSFEL